MINDKRVLARVVRMHYATTTKMYPGRVKLYSHGKPEAGIPLHVAQRIVREQGIDGWVELLEPPPFDLKELGVVCPKEKR